MRMKHIVSYSGGLGSAITAKALVDVYGKEHVTLLFADTKTEDDDLYRFNTDVQCLLQCEFITIQDGRDVWEVFEDVKFIGNSRIDPCSKLLKRDLIKKWIHSNYSPEECNIWVGIDYSEEHRLPPVIQNNLPYTYRSWFIENDIILFSYLKELWCKEYNIEIPRLYKMGFSHNNCGGFCVKGGLGHFKNLWEKLPEVYLENEMREEALIARNPKLRPFLKKMIKGKIYYLTMKQYREKYLMLGNISEEDKLDFGGCGCAL